MSDSVSPHPPQHLMLSPFRNSAIRIGLCSDSRSGAWLLLGPAGGPCGTRPGFVGFHWAITITMIGSHLKAELKVAHLAPTPSPGRGLF